MKKDEEDEKEKSKQLSLGFYWRGAMRWDSYKAGTHDTLHDDIGCIRETSLYPTPLQNFLLPSKITQVR